MFARYFLLTIKRNQRKAQHTLDHLRFAGIVPEVFYGLDGEVTGLETKHTYELDNPGTGYKIGPKTVSMYLGHMMVWKACEFLNGDAFMIMEDDARFTPDWKAHFDFAIPALPANWDLLYLGSCCVQGTNPKQISGHLHKVTHALCTHCYAIRKKAIPTLVDACEKVYAGVDIAMSLHAIPKLNTFAFLPRIVDQFQTEISP